MFKNIYRHIIQERVPISNVKIENIREATERDEQSQTLIITILRGWPEERENCLKAVTEY